MIAWALLVIGATLLVTDSKLGSGIRWLALAVGLDASCAQCVGFWVGLILSCGNRSIVPMTQYGPWEHHLCDGFCASAMMVMWRLLERSAWSRPAPSGQSTFTQASVKFQTREKCETC